MQAQSEVMAHSQPAERCERRYRRTIFSVPINVRMLMPGGVRATHGVSLDISESGMGAIVQNELTPGEVIEVELKLAAWDLTAVALVRHSSATRSGFEFLGLSPQERQQLARLVASP